jgi:hypothetical protein
LRAMARRLEPRPERRMPRRRGVGVAELEESAEFRVIVAYR